MAKIYMTTIAFSVCGCTNGAETHLCKNCKVPIAAACRCFEDDSPFFQLYKIEGEYK